MIPRTPSLQTLADQQNPERLPGVGGSRSCVVEGHHCLDFAVEVERVVAALPADAGDA